ncbi:MAG: capsular biosynthesis protein [Alloprevotella sp.]|nr:capsular biosynthesis protein [Alloprevotella sp.]
MFGFLKSKKNIVESGFFAGNTDWHCHILPGVDDGIQKLEDSLAVLAYYEQLGIDTIWLTPHIMVDIPNTPARLRERYELLCESYNGPIKLHLAAEHMMDSLFDERLEAGEVIPIGQDGNHLLVETSYFNPPYDLKGTLRRIQQAGYHPILAHPERYLYLEMSGYDELKDMNVRFQVNLPSIVGMYGEPQRRRALHLLKKGYYNLWGSDLHRLSSYQKALDAKVFTKEILSQVHFNYEFLND